MKIICAFVRLLAVLILSLRPGVCQETGGNIRIYTAIELEFATAFGCTYQIQSSSNLIDWAAFGSPVSGTGTNYNLLVSTKNTQRRFYRLQPASAGLVAFYRFDGDAIDSSGNGNHGIAYNVVLTTNRFGQPNSAYYFMGTSDSYIGVSDSPSLNITNAITLAAWINFEVGGTVYPRIINKFAYELATGPHDLDTRDFYFTIEGPVQTQLASPTDVLQAGRWHFVAATYDGTVMVVYVDGVALASTSAPGGILSTALDLNIGRNVQNQLDNYQGIIDDVRIYNRALSPCEISDLLTARE